MGRRGASHLIEETALASVVHRASFPQKRLDPPPRLSGGVQRNRDTVVS
jgi:hypothetical protein